MRNALVTGPSSGIGREVTLQLARLGFHVVAAGRSRQRVDAVVDEVRAAGGSAESLILDLASLESARQAARTFESSERTLDVLVNNAGIGITRGVTTDGFQLQFGVNHLGHFMLTEFLRRTFQPGTRIVSVSSNMHYRAKGIDFDLVTRITPRGGGIDAYAESKLANVLFIRELAQRHPDWSTYAVHPGVADTGIFPNWSRPLVRPRTISLEEAADTIVWCATELTGSSGGYFAKRTQHLPSEVALDDDLARELWTRSEQWCGVGPVN